MKTKYIRWILGVLIGGIFLSGIMSPFSDYGVVKEKSGILEKIQKSTLFQGQEVRAAEYQTHSYIYITSESELDAFCADNGTDGSISNPYIIQNYYIDIGGGGNCGIHLENILTRYVIIQNCIVNNSLAMGFGSILLANCNNTIIRYCFTLNSNIGIHVAGSTYCLVYNNTISNCYNEGIFFEAPSYCQAYKNIVVNSNQGISSRGNNTIYLNYIDNNIPNGYSSDIDISNWDNGTLGNYWGDYQSRYPMATNNGGIWDTPYLINNSAIQYDNYPLVDPNSVFASESEEENSSFIPAAPYLYPILPSVSTNGTVIIFWDPVASTTIYFIYRDNQPISSVVGRTAIGYSYSNTYSDINIPEGNYCYVVVAHNQYGDSAPSDDECTTVDRPDPSPEDPDPGNDAVIQDDDPSNPFKDVPGYPVMGLGIIALCTLGLVIRVGKPRIPQ